MRAREYKLCEKIGPGGIKCSCCADKGSKKRTNRKFRRTKKVPIASALAGQTPSRQGEESS